MNFQPTHDNVLVQRGNPTQSTSEVIRANSNRESSFLTSKNGIVGGIVQAIGPLVECCYPEDLVLFDDEHSYRLEDIGIEIIESSYILARHGKQQDIK